MATSQTLRAVIDAGRTSKRLDELSTARVLGKIAEQTHAAQQKAGAGKAIGPITPSSISIDEAGAAKLGLAEPSAVAYSSPEQISGDPGDRRSDVFSLGIVMWEALTHERLFDGSDGEIMAAVMTKPIASPFELNANVPAELGVICMKALSRNPGERYQSAKVMAAEIEAVLDDSGYADTDERIAEYMADFGKPLNLPKVTLPPPIVVEVAPPEPMKLPSILDKAPTEPPAKMTAPSAGSLSPASFSKPPTQPPPILNATGHPVKLNDTLPSLGAPLPPVLPAKPAASMELPKATPAATVLGFATAETTVPDSAVRTSEPEMDAATTPFVPVEPSAAQSDPVLLTRPKSPTQPEPQKPAPAVLVDDPHRVTQVAPVHSHAAAPVVVATKELSGPSRKRDLTPHPASIVALPRESQEVLGGWGWGTDSHPALAEFNEYEDDASPAAASRKTLLYMIGGGIAVALIVTIIAVGFGSSSTPKRVPPQPAAAVQEGSAGSAVAEIGSAPGSAEPAAGSAVVPEVVVDAAEVAAVTPDAAIAVAPPPPPVDAAAAAPIVVAPPPPPPVVATPKPKPKPPAPKPIDPYATPKRHADPPRVAHNASSAEVESAYKQGLQLYLKGDLQGALGSLRTALAGNANYPPTWRGLGLVFEKMGEKDQARAAYRRYLALAPSAGDAESIRGRLERLGP